MNSRVFLIEDVDRDRFDLSSVRPYGEIIVLHSDTGDRPALYSDEYNEWLIHKLQFEYRFDGNCDLLLLCGHLLSIAKAVSILCQDWLSFGALAFNAKSGIYEKVSLGDVAQTEEVDNTARQAG